eukprot:Opistho-1_new@42024
METPVVMPGKRLCNRFVTQRPYATAFRQPIQGASMRKHFFPLTSALALAAAMSGPAHAQTEIQWWHSMTGGLNDWVLDLANGFNASQKEYKIVPTYKGTGKKKKKKKKKY